MFLGTYKHQPNIQAVELLLTRIWPRIIKANPSARLIVAGSWPENIAAFGSVGPEVEFTGFVDDLEELYRRSRVVCAPIRSGSGTRIKIIEAAAYGKPVVSTSIGAEGLVLRNDRELLIRDDPDAFADGCIALLEDNELCARLGSSARQAARKYYSRDAIVQRIRHVVGNIVSANQSGRSPSPDNH
jgi:glycosyltransferase involved in cell wall biosynthesis